MSQVRWARNFWIATPRSIRLFVLLTLLDAAITVLILQFPATEMNPLGLTGVMGIKVVGVAGVLTLPRFLRGDALLLKVMDVAVWVLVACYAGLVVWNLANLVFIFFG